MVKFMDINVGVIGSTGLVGQEMIKCLEKLNDVRINIFCYASSDSDGKVIHTDKAIYKVEKLEETIFKGLHYALFATSSEISEEYVTIAIKYRCICIDNSSYFRLKKDVPLICYGVNENEIFKHKGIIANPNCSTIQLMRTLKIIDDLYDIKRVIVSTYQSVSGVGKSGIDEYNLNQYIDLPSYNAFPYSKSKVHYSIKNNLIPQIDEFNFDNHYTKEELKMSKESSKILKKDLHLSATCIRVPILRGHGESVSVETLKQININEIIEIFKKDKYIDLQDDIKEQKYPLVKECYYSKKAIVGRIRKDLFTDTMIHYYVVGDNLYLGAAYNAVMILYHLIGGQRNEIL